MKSKLISIFILLISFLFLWYSRPSGVGLEDSGGFFLSACNFGISHPPGYPLFNLAGGIIRLASKPFFDCIDSILFLNISIASFSILLCYHILILLIDNSIGSFEKRFISILLSLILLSSRSFSFLARSSEVYILHLFFVILLTYVLLKLKITKSNKYKNLFFLVFGFSLTNHWPLIIILFPFFIFYIYFLKVNKFIFSDIFKSSLFFLSGFSIYLFYFINPYISDYFFYSQVTSISDAIHLFLRKDQMVMDVLPTWEIKDSLFFTLHFFERIVSEFGIITSFLGILGGLIYYPLFILFISIPIILPVLWRTEVNQFTLEMFRYWELSSYFSIILGISFSLLFIRSKLKEDKFKNYFMLLSYIVFILIILFSAKNQIHLKDDSLASDYSRLVLDTLPKNSVLFVHKDTEAGIIGFENYGRNYRSDVEVISQVSALFPKRVFLRKKNPSRESQRIPILNYISKELEKGKRVFTTRKFEQFNETAFFPMQYSQYGIYFEIDYEKKQVSIDKYLIDRAKNILKLESLRREKLLEQSIFYSRFDLPWNRYREFLTRDICHTLLIFERELDDLKNLSECKFIHAQWIHVNNKEYEFADEEFRKSLSSFNYLYKSELVERYRDFLINRISYINSLSIQKDEKRKLILNTILYIKQIAINYRYCENKLAIKLLNLANEISYKDEELLDWNKNCK